ncbi:MAG: hypothetical protein FJ316_02775 [SAR202 cluster bacterium]|nr:hypothetical protein [SAR202 cluster bacterium]
MGVAPRRRQGLASSDSHGQPLDAQSLAQLGQRRWAQAAEMAAWLTQDALSQLSLEQVLALYRAAGGRRVAEFAANPIAEVRDSLDFLLYDNVTLEGRFAECAAEDGAYKLAGAGKEFVSYCLCLRDPSLFAPWRSYTEQALRQLDLYPPALRRGHLGLRYLDLLEALQTVMRRHGLADFRAADDFCYAIARVKATQN